MTTERRCTATFGAGSGYCDLQDGHGGVHQRGGTFWGDDTYLNDLSRKLEEATAAAELAGWFRQTLRHKDGTGKFIGGDAALDAMEFARRYDALKANQ